MTEPEGCREAILSETYYDFIVSNDRETVFEKWIGEDTCRQDMEFLYQSVYFEKEAAGLLSFGRFPYNSIPKCYTLLDMEAMTEAGILQIQNYPTLNLQGTGVLIGFVDVGIDYQNPLFRNLDGSTRLAAIWDQTIQSGKPPEGYSFGTEYVKEEIDKALSHTNPLEVVPSTDTNGHGTFGVSLAAGGVDERTHFIGAAPDAAIGIVKLKPAKVYLKEFYQIYTDAPCFQENDIMLGITYLNRLAKRLSMPLVLCLALGTNQGGHSGLSPLSKMLEILASTENRAVVIGGGNEANERHHFLGRAERSGNAKTVEIRIEKGVRGFFAELWTENPNIFGVTVLSPTGGSTGRIPIRREETQSFPFLLERTTLSVDCKLFLEGSNSQLITFQFQNPTEGIWKVIADPVQVADGMFHMWLPVSAFLENEVSFLESNPDCTITEPGCAMGPMTVGFYNGEDNSVAIFSGRGYTRGNVVKPNFAAPGVNVTGAALKNQFEMRTGSSIAAAITAGACALVLEWTFYELLKDADSIQIRNLLTLGAKQNQGESYPNPNWGYGSLSLLDSFEKIRRI